MRPIAIASSAVRTMPIELPAGQLGGLVRGAIVMGAVLGSGRVAL